MVEAKNGGPAFPRPRTNKTEADYGCTEQSGMSLLAYYAGEAMKGKLAAEGTPVAQLRTDFCHECFELAAAMLEEAKLWHA